MTPQKDGTPATDGLLDPLCSTRTDSIQPNTSLKNSAPAAATHTLLIYKKPYIEVADETQRVELAKWDKAEKQNDIKGDNAKKLENVDEEKLKKVFEILMSA